MYPGEQVHKPVLWSHFPRLLHSMWQRLPDAPVGASVDAPLLDLPLQSVSSALVTGSFPEGHLRLEQPGPKNSASWCCPDASPTLHE